MDKNAAISSILASLLAIADPVYAASDNPFGLVYADAIRENAPGKVQIPL